MVIHPKIRQLKWISWCIIILFLFFHEQLFSQQSDIKITLNINNRKLSDILDSLSTRFNVNFSYNAEIPAMREIRTISITAGLDEILSKLLQSERLEFSKDGNHIIIYKTLSLPPDEPIQKKIEKFIVFKGKIFEKKTSTPLPFASVSISRSSIGTVANDNGEFTIRVPDSLIHDTLIISFIGFQTEKRYLNSLVGNFINISLNENPVNIDKVIIKPLSGLEIVKEMIENIGKNYSRQNAMYTAFYREATRKDDDYISICEAVLDISKASYSSRLYNDQARIFKGRKTEDTKQMQKLSYKLEGGVYNCLSLDVIKEKASFLSYESFDQYDYTVIRKVPYNNQILIVVEFKQKENVEMPFYDGIMYIDAKTKALVATKFCLSPSGLKYARSLLVKKEPSKYQLKPIGAEYQVYYRNINGKWYLDYLRGEIKIKAKSNKWFFNSTFTSFSEIAVTEIDTNNTARFKWNEITKSSDIMVDFLKDNDENFWSNYNLIQPNQPLQEAIKKINIKKSLYTDKSEKDKLF